MKSSLFLSTAILLPALLVGSAADAQQQQSRSAGQEASGQCPDHFATLDTDKNNRISQKEERAVREKVFASLDQDKDNVVSREEYVKCLISTPAFSAAAVGRGGQSQQQASSSLLGISDKRAEQQFRQVDANGDGKVGWREYMNAAKAEHAESGKAGDSKAPASAGWAFARMDANLDGDLTLQEWTNLSDPQTFAETSFKAIDRNGDGKISKQEYQQMADQRFNSSRSTQSSAANRPGQPNQQATADDIEVWEYVIWY